MAFPTIPTVAANRVLSVLATNPAGTHTSPSLTTLDNNAGDLLIAIVILYDGNSTNAEFSAWGGGFTEFGDFAGTATMAIGCAYKFSDGTETGTFTVTSADASANDSAFFLLSIPGASAVTPPEAGSFATGTGAANPASFNPAGWDAEDTLWIAVGGSGETSTTGSYTGLASAPTNYTDYADSGISADAVGGVEGAVAFRQLNAASEDVGAFTGDTSNARDSALVIAVRPITPSTISVTAGVASNEAVGSHTLIPVASILPGGIDGGAFGSHTLLPGPVIVIPTGVDSAGALGSAILYALSTLLPGAISSEEAFGAHLLLPGGVSVIISGIGSDEAVAQPVVFPGGVLVVPGAVDSAEALGNPVLYSLATIIANAIASAESVSTPIVLPGGVLVQVAAIDSAEQLGATNLLPGAVQIVVNGIGSDEVFGAHIVSIAGGGPAALFIDPTGIAGNEAFGTVNLYTVALVTPASIGSEESWGAISAIPGGVQIVVTGLSSDENVAQPVLRGSFTLLPSSIDTAEGLGIPVLYARTIIAPVAIDGTGDFGLASLLPGEVLIEVTSISSGEVIGLAVVGSAALQTAIQWAHSASFGDSRHKSFTPTQSRFGKTRRDQ